MEREEIKKKATDIIVLHLGVEQDAVTEQAQFVNDLGCDSMDLVELVMAFDEEFNIETPDAEAECIHTVKDAIDLIAAKL